MVYTNNVISFNIKDLPDDLMKITDLANKYQCAKSYIYKLINGNKIKKYKIGIVKVSESEFLRYCLRN